jgi:AraC-like DNA-binding protein
MNDDGRAADAGLERLCEAGPADRLNFAPEGAGIARLEAQLSTCVYRPHRHDTYAIGLTVRGVQSYTYRGAQRDSLPGEVVVLHPDEMHDGKAGTESGLLYRMLYIEPAMVLDALGGRVRHLPFVPDGHTTDRRLARALARALADLNGHFGALEADEVVGEVAEALADLDPGARLRARESRAVPSNPVRRAVDLLRSTPMRDWTSMDLERETGLDRFELARGFRRAYGTTPHRYLIMRRLETARAMARETSCSLAEIAVETRFADQAHLTRHFRKAFGITPGAWRSLLDGRSAKAVS